MREGIKRTVSSLLCQKLVLNETPVLPNAFSVETLSESDINSDSAIKFFLSPNQADKDLTAITDADMINKDNVPDNEDVHKGAKRSSTGDAHGEELGKRAKIPEQPNPVMNCVSYGTVNIH